MNIDKQTGRAVNSGKPFENDIKRTADAYRRASVMVLEKVDPPTKVVGRPGAWKILYMPSPFVDFTGAWIERGGRTLAIEVKSTSKPILPLFGTSGFTDAQWFKMNVWHHAGAAVGLLWQFDGMVCWIGYRELAALTERPVKSVRFGGLRPVGKGLGFVLWDFRQRLAEDYPEHSGPNPLTPLQKIVDEVLK